MLEAGSSRNAAERALGTSAKLVAIALLGTASGCAPGPAVSDRLQACGLVSEDGEVGPSITRLFYQPTECYRACLAAATCEELQATLCGSSIELLRRCDEQCAYRCDDGAFLAVEQVCNGLSECAGGEDEAGCPTVPCDDGSTTTGRRCDGHATCPDGSDEAGCPACVTLGGTTVLLRQVRCNRRQECADGSDELGCPEHRCDDGTTLVRPEGDSLRCDGWTQCPDASDERGCARLETSCS